MSQITNFNTGGVLPPSVATQYTTDVGIAIPVANNLNVFGGTGGRDINTSGAGDTIHIDLDNSISLGDLAVLGAGVDALLAVTGDITIDAGNFNLPTTISANTGVVNVNSLPFLHSFGTSNTFLGENAGNFTLTVINSSFNTAVGWHALMSLTDGPANTAMGTATLGACTAGSGNSGFGFQPLATLTTGSNNTAIGGVCMNSLLSGSGNVGLGSALSALSTGNDNIGIGDTAGQAYNAAESENIVIGSQGVVGDTKTIRIGTTGGGGIFQTSCYISGIDGVNVGSTAKVVSMGTGGTADQLGTTVITAGSGITVTPGANTITIAATGGSGITITGDTGGALGPASAFTFTGGSTGLVFNGAVTTETLGGTLVVSNGGTGRTTLTNHGILVGAGTTAITQLAAASDGQLPIGSTGADPVIATLTAGTNISITNGAGSITIAGTGAAGFVWSVITANQTAAVNNGYFCNKAGTLALLLPAVSAVGDTIEVANENTALGVQFTQAAGQQILIGNTNTTLGATGTLTSSAVGDTLKIVCKTANNIWRVTSIVGNWTPA